MKKSTPRTRAGKKKKRSSTISGLIAMTAHQLRTPLIGLQWSCNFLTSGEAGEMQNEQKKIVTEMAGAVHYMLTMVNDLLDAHQIERGHFDLALKKQSIVPVLERLPHTFKSILDQKGVACTLTISPALAPVMIDSDKIEIAINNIMDNSINYSPRGMAVEIEAARKESKIVVSIRNFGTSILPADRKKIFTKFFRAPSAHSEHKIGTGLGLYISKNIVEQHGGKIWFDSKEKEGITFYISLPVAE